MQNMPQVLLGHPATYEDLVRVPDHLVAEIVDGELWTSPRPVPRHARAQTFVGATIATPYAYSGQDHARPEPFDEVDVHLALVWDDVWDDPEHTPAVPSQRGPG
jgi:hypothetical protein